MSDSLHDAYIEQSNGQITLPVCTCPPTTGGMGDPPFAKVEDHVCWNSTGPVIEVCHCSWACCQNNKPFDTYLPDELVKSFGDLYPSASDDEEETEDDY